MEKLEKIVSGGQTGADRGALQAALNTKTDHGGWCPKGRRSENGPIPDCFHLKETETSSYPSRTWKNVRDSDGTLILTQGVAERGSKLTIEFCKKQEKPWLHVRLEKWTASQKVRMIKSWIRRNSIHVCNVAGNRESKTPGIEKETEQLITQVILELRESLAAHSGSIQQRKPHEERRD